MWKFHAVRCLDDEHVEPDRKGHHSEAADVGRFSRRVHECNNWRTGPTGAQFFVAGRNGDLDASADVVGSLAHIQIGQLGLEQFPHCCWIEVWSLGDADGQATKSPVAQAVPTLPKYGCPASSRQTTTSEMVRPAAKASTHDDSDSSLEHATGATAAATTTASATVGIRVLEDVGPDDRSARTVEWYGQLARLLGQMNCNRDGAGQRPSWFTRDFVGGEARWAASLVAETVAPPPDGIARLYSEQHQNEMAAVARNCDRLLATLDSLPKGMAHLDAFSRNVFQRDDDLALIDWGSSAQHRSEPNWPGCS